MFADRSSDCGLQLSHSSICKQHVPEAYAGGGGGVGVDCGVVDEGGGVGCEVADEVVVVLLSALMSKRYRSAIACISPDDKPVVDEIPWRDSQ